MSRLVTYAVYRELHRRQRTRYQAYDRRYNLDRASADGWGEAHMRRSRHVRSLKVEISNTVSVLAVIAGGPR